jgi:hypothetical protein
MKIGILTLPVRTNYGGILQAYALQTVLKNMGHEVLLIREYKKLPLWKAPFAYAKRILFRYVLKKQDVIDIFYERKEKRLLPIVSKNTQPFIDKYMQVIDMAWVKNNEIDFDAIVVGSDQIWRPKYAPNITNAYLSFAKNRNIKRIAYAASFGTDKWEYNIWQSVICKHLVKKFDAVSVREKSGVELCKRHFCIDAMHVLDPTMLLDIQHYVSLMKKEKVRNSKNKLFVYVLDRNEDTTRIEMKICSVLNLNPFYSSTDNTKALIKDRIATKVEIWLHSLYDADFILTDSFHACVFSILFNKPFIVYGNKDRGISRFDSLLELFNLKSRLATSERIDLQQIIEMPIDWKEVNKTLQEQRELSFQFLNNVLGIAN